MADLILEIVEGEAAGRQVPLTGSVEIGREPSLGVPLEEDTEVSRRHARVSLEEGHAFVDDLGSTNGTYVNDQPIQSGRSIAPGDRIRVGLTVLQLRDAREVARRPSAVRQGPQVTAVGQDILQPAAPHELAPPAAAGPNEPGFLSEETEPAFVPRDVIGDRDAEANYAAVHRLVDTRVKQQTHTAVFALLGAAGIAVLLAFGLK